MRMVIIIPFYFSDGGGTHALRMTMKCDHREKKKTPNCMEWWTHKKNEWPKFMSYLFVKSIKGNECARKI